ncbi:MAG: hypothetical protein F4090_07000 [Nitrospira sp. SB0672_bin_25]|nr:hypothetical protein [Nitrospira sp. SB0666_bin_27]MYF25500.1 hypothetical protein [Nitrospira sp. SB0678_bin_10]MYJ54631.1 hypothetical protein [Nitrospira sp. SB0672_bin_25]
MDDETTYLEGVRKLLCNGHQVDMVMFGVLVYEREQEPNQREKIITELCTWSDQQVWAWDALVAIGVRAWKRGDDPPDLLKRFICFAGTHPGRRPETPRRGGRKWRPSDDASETFRLLVAVYLLQEVCGLGRAAAAYSQIETWSRLSQNDSYEQSKAWGTEHTPTLAFIPSSRLKKKLQRLRKSSPVLFGSKQSLHIALSCIA